MNNLTQGTGLEIVSLIRAKQYNIVRDKLKLAGRFDKDDAYSIVRHFKNYSKVPLDIRNCLYEGHLDVLETL